MCWSIAPTTFGESITGMHQANEKVHVTWYENAVLGLTPGRPRPGVLSATAERGLTAPRTSTRRGQRRLPDNWDDGSDDEGATGTGNGLVIPLLTDNFNSIRLLDTEGTPNLLTDIRRALQPTMGRTLRRNGAKSLGADTVIVQKLGIYTLVLASRASLIPNAVNSPAVEPRKRPPTNQDGFDALEEGYDCPVVVACFDNREKGRALPIAYAYEARFPKHFLLYTLDGHDGKRPDLNAYVEMDHVLFASSYRMQAGKGTQINYRNAIPADLEQYVPRQVLGQVVPKGTKVLNGDVLLNVDKVAQGIWDPKRVIPPNAKPARKPIPFAEAIQATSGRKKPWR